MLYDFHLGQTSVVLRVKLRNSSVSTGAGLTGLTFSSTGLKISTIADNEATATSYTVAGSTIETITTLGTYAAPTATKCRFKEVDATNHPGLYEVQIADARFAVANAKSLTVSFSGGTNLAECDVVVPLRAVDPYVADFGLNGAVPPATPTLGTWGDAMSYASSRVGRRGTAQAGTTTTITLDSGAASVDNAYRDHSIRLMTGTGSGQFATIIGYVGSTKVATISRPSAGGTWTTTPDATTTFLIALEPMVSLEPTQQFNNTAQTTKYAATIATGDGVDAAAIKTTLGVAGAGLTALGDTRIANLDAAVSTRLATLGATAPAGWINTAAFASGATLPRVTLTDTVTTYTGNTPQTGDNFARIGVNGAGLTAVGLTLDNGTVSASPTPTTTTFTATGNLNAPAGGYTSAPMSVFWQTGPNRGVKYAISAHTVSGSNHAFTVATMAATPTTGDTFIIG